MAFKIGVSPPSYFNEKHGLFDALGKMFSVEFSPATLLDSKMWDAFVAVTTDGATENFPGRIPGYICDLSCASFARAPDELRVFFNNSAGLDPRLRQRSLIEQEAWRIHPVPPLAGTADEVIATLQDLPVWRITHNGHAEHYRAGTELPELTKGQGPRNFLQRGRFFSLLPLFHFLRHIAPGQDWTMPGLRANIVFDDPNLRSLAYGYINFERLAWHAEKYGYHATMATIPLDLKTAHPGALRIFKQHPDRLSLSYHGNNHTTHELAQQLPDEAIRGLLAQALERGQRFEHKYELAISRVQAAPHDDCSLNFIRNMRCLHYEAIIKSDIQNFNGECPPARFDSGLGPAEMVEGLPVIRRIPLKQAITESIYQDDLVLSSYLNLPIVLYGHHDDVARGLDGVAEIVSFINALGPVQWRNLTAISRSNISTKVFGSQLHIRPYARHFNVEVPSGVEELVVDIEHLACYESMQIQHSSDNSPTVMKSQYLLTKWLGPQALILLPNTNRCEIEFIFQHKNTQYRMPLLQPYAVFRRFLTSCRDRLKPMINHFPG